MTRNALLLPALLLLVACQATPQPTRSFVPIPTKPPTFRSTATPTREPRTYRPVTWSELARFVEDDHTNWNDYDPTAFGGSYVCANFALDLMGAAEQAGIEAGLVLVDWTEGDGAHAFVWFLTTDKGKVWIEPQTDFAYVVPAADITFQGEDGTTYLYPERTPLADTRGVAFKTHMAKALELSPDLTLSCEPAPSFECAFVGR